jgi:hypothetical protein
MLLLLAFMMHGFANNNFHASIEQVATCNFVEPSSMICRIGWPGWLIIVFGIWEISSAKFGWAWSLKRCQTFCSMTFTKFEVYQNRLGLKVSKLAKNTIFSSFLNF